MDPFLTLHRLLHSLQEKYRHVRKASKLDLNMIEIHTLLELDAESSLTISDIAAVLNIDPSVASRTIQLLSRKDLVEVEEIEGDTRQRYLRLTKAGKQKLTRVDTMAGETFDTFAVKLSTKEQLTLAHFFGLIADGMGQVKTHPRMSEKPFRHQHRRVTRALGFLKKDVFHSGLSSSDWMTLSEICQREIAPTAKDLAQLLTLAPNSMTSIVEKLESDNLISRTTDPDNHRRRLLLPTNKGIEFLKNLEHDAASELRVILLGLPSRKLSEYIELLKTFVGDWAVHSDTLPPYLTVQRVKQLQDARMVRSFIIRELVKNELENFIPENFFSTELEIWALFDEREGKLKRKLCSACLCDSAEHLWSVQVIAWSAEISRRGALSFIRSSYLASTSGGMPRELRIDFQPFQSPRSPT